MKLEAIADMLQQTLRAGTLAILLLAGARMAAAAEPALPDKSAWVQFTSFSYAGVDTAAGLVKAPGQEFSNPVLAGFYSDPSVCRVGEDYYLVNSSFSYFPGVPIFHSRNLVDWEQIGYVLDQRSQFSTLRDGDVSRGIYAATIRYHDGTFYVITTMVNGGGNFYVTAKNPAGPWSEPNWLPDVDGIDPSLFFDDDGRAYVVHCGPAPDNRPAYDGHRSIRLRELDLKTGKMTGPEKILVSGGTDISKKPQWIEGPHIFKHDGRFILIAAQGGTEANHSEVAFAADDLWGPYTPFADNPILTQRDLPADRPNPITCTGHADLVETQTGQWWAVFLGCQPYERNWFNTGRETFLLPVQWENNWPIVLKANVSVPAVVKRPDLPAAAEPVKTPMHGTISWTDKFDRPTLNLRWNFLRLPTQTWYSLDDAAGLLRIAPRGVDLSSHGNPSLIACRQQHATFTATTAISIADATAPCDAGLAAFQNETHYYFLGIRINAGKASEVFLEQAAAAAPRANAAVVAKVLASAVLPAGAGRVELRIEGAGRPYAFSYRAIPGEFKSLLQGVDGSFLSTDVAGGFQGVMLGMYARTRP
jgi:alpha-N-arabinofuranosidase